MHFRTLLVIVLTGTVAILGSGAGCSMLSNSDSSKQVNTNTADVDRLDVPDQISPTDTLSVTLHGTVGPNGCYSFDRFDVERSSKRLTVTPLVHHRTGDDVACTMAIVPLEETYKAPPPFSDGTWTITVPQPEGEDRSATVEVIPEGG